jgi:hypothetical protein
VELLDGAPPDVPAGDPPTAPPPPPPTYPRAPVPRAGLTTAERGRLSSLQRRVDRTHDRLTHADARFLLDLVDRLTRLDGEEP